MHRPAVNQLDCVLRVGLGRLLGCGFVGNAFCTFKLIELDKED